MPVAQEWFFVVVISIAILIIGILYLLGLFFVLGSTKNKIWGMLYVLIGLIIFTLVIIFI